MSHYFWHACFVDILILSRMIPKELQLRMLHMFDTDISAIIDGVEIDTPQNALSLAQSISPTFYAFTIYLNEIKDRNNIYQISNHDKTISDANKLPREANFNNSNHSNINPPSHHLLTIHRAISKILHYQRRASTLMRSSKIKESMCSRTDLPTWMKYSH